jgi:hypothetical protein
MVEPGAASETPAETEKQGRGGAAGGQGCINAGYSTQNMGDKAF